MTVCGILNLDKPPDVTSFHVVATVRRLSGVKKAGHAGTLDPLATGVLLVCLGQAARVSEYLMELPKTYRAMVRLGVATDTYDSTGVPIREGDASAVDEAGLREALGTLEAREEQVPPAYSAIKVGGEPSYKLARAGRPVTLRPRKTVIESIELLSFRTPDVEIDVRCGKGTYIRTLADDLGGLLGCGAHLTALRRTSVGPFSAEEGTSLERLQAAFEDGSWQELLLPLDYGLAHIPAVYLDMESEKDVRHGCALDARLRAFERAAAAEGGERRRAYGEDGAFIAVLSFDSEASLWKPSKVFAPPEPRL